MTELYLYKYFNPSGRFNRKTSRLDAIKKILIKNKIFIPSLELLNDPFELLINNQRNDTIGKSINQKGVLSFTTTFKNLLMWSHYSNGHKGIAIKFKIDLGKSNILKKVQYVKDIGELAILNSMLVKNSEWSYENEYRIITDESLKEITLQDLGLTIDSVIFGFKCTPRTKKEILEICFAAEIKTSEVRLRNDFSFIVTTPQTAEERFFNEAINKYYYEVFKDHIEDVHDEDSSDDYDPNEHIYTEAKASKEYIELLNKKETLKVEFGIS